MVDAQQRVVAGSATADRLTPLLRPDELERALAGEALVVDGVRLGSDEPLRVRAVAAGPAADPLAVIAAVPFGDVLAIRTALRNALLITFPVLLAALAAIAYRVIGWALRPVEELRAGAEQISTLRVGSGEPREDRLPVPPAADEIRALAITLNGMLDRLAVARQRQRLVRRRRGPRAAQPAGQHAGPGRGGRTARRGRHPARRAAGRPEPAVRPGRGPAAAGPGRRRRPAAGPAGPGGRAGAAHRGGGRRTPGTGCRSPSPPVRRSS